MNEQNAGGIATGTINEAQKQIVNEADFIRLQSLRRSGLTPTSRSDGYMAVMLTCRAGWSSTQAAEFLGLPATTVETWRSTYQNQGLLALEDLPQPTSRNQ